MIPRPSPGSKPSLLPQVRKSVLRILLGLVAGSLVIHEGPLGAASFSKSISQAATQHWAFRPITKPSVPIPSPAEGNEVDFFIQSALKARGLEPSPPVSPEQWIRRVTLDLIGLPPTWQEVQSFVQDTSANAREKVVDRLLASPRYGERWGRHWLDLARYADTHGGSAIGFTKFPFSYTYRDYVIRSFNADVRYDRFILEQIAADELDLPKNDPALAGLGFLTVGMQYRNRHDVIDDQIDVISRGLMGLTVSCARCHDHKFDPISIGDYYSLYAALAPSSSPDVLPVIGNPDINQTHRDYEKELGRLQRRHDDMAAEQNEIMRSRLRMQVGMYLREIAKGLPEQDISTAFLSYRTDDLRPLIYNRWRDYLGKMPDTDPVFGPWVRLSKLASDGFAQACTNLLRALEKENGDPAKWKNEHVLTAEAPTWNPRVIEELLKKPRSSMVDVAEGYGDLFAAVNQAWLQALIRASAEAAPGGEIIPDEDSRQKEINSPIQRQLRRHLYGPESPTSVTDALAATLLNRSVTDNLGGRQGAIHELHLNNPGSPARAMVLQESDSPEVYHVLKRGNPLARGETVRPRFLSVLTQGDPRPFPDGERRLSLARAVVSQDNPLTRRVLVNWIWQHHFGQGLVKSPDDWGTRGQRPTHPELLDYLASVFAEEGWSIKQMHKRILLSHTYAQAAVERDAARNVDPENDLLWRMPRRRLDMEAMLDSMLAVSGELDPSMGGRPFDRQTQPGVLRRNVYAFVNRDIVSNLSSTFDAANPSACTARRPDTTVPQQALFALNSDFIQDRAKALASAVLKAQPQDNARRVHELYRRVYGREPGTRELERILRFVQTRKTDQTDAAWQQVAHSLLASNEFAFVD